MSVATAQISQAASLTTQLMNPLLASMSEVFQVTLGNGIRRGKLEIRPANAQLRDVTAWMCLNGCVNGVVSLSFDSQTAITAAGKMLGEEPPEINDDVIDALSEITNMVVGGAKSRLEIGLSIGLPTVVAGNRKILFPGGSKPMRLECDSDIGAVSIDFGFVFQPR